MKSWLWNYTATSISQAKTPSPKSVPVSGESLYLHNKDRGKMYVKICIYDVLNYSFHRSLLKRSVQFLNELPEKKTVTKSVGVYRIKIEKASTQSQMH